MAPAAVLAHAEASLPHPIARATRAFQLAHTPREQYEELLDAAEALAIVVSTTVAALLHGKCAKGPGRRDGDRAALSALQRSYFTYSGATFGTWTTWLGSISPLAELQPELTPGFRTALSGQGDSGIATHLNALREERNRSAHGGKPRSQQEAALRVAQYTPHLEAALAGAAFLEHLPWLLVASCDYQPRTQDFSVVAGRAMGGHPDFERRTYTWTTPVADEMFYVLDPSGPVAMFPYVANLFCPQCEQSEVCYTYKAERNSGPAYLKSFSRGHEMSDEELGSEIRSLLDFQAGDGA